LKFKCNFFQKIVLNAKNTTLSVVDYLVDQYRNKMISIEQKKLSDNLKNMFEPND
jgi:hypothetical protein